ncbi:MAG: PKD domain-containing protein [Bacteroidia bacterium]
MLTRRFYIVFFLLLNLTFFAFSQIVKTAPFTNYKLESRNPKFIAKPFQNRIFVEEQGQFRKLVDEKNIQIPGKILYGIDNAEFMIFFTSNGFSLVFSETEKIKRKKREEKEEEDEEGLKTTWEVINVEWLNANSTVSVFANDKVNDYNTYGPYKDKTQYNNVAGFNKLNYTNIFDGVDAEFELPKEGGLKYKFIVHAGNKVPSIALKINNSRRLFLDKENNLHIEGKLNALIDKAPNAFINKTEIPIKYELKNNVVTFVTQLDAGTPLLSDLIIDPWIIDPLIPAANKAYDIQEDSLGNVFVYGGNASSSSQLQKYDALGNLQWTYNTSHMYYGDIAVANSGSIYLLVGIPGQIIKLNPSGAVIGTGPNGSEYWRLAFNKSKTILALGGNFAGGSLARLDTASLAVTDIIAYDPDIFAMATDCNGDIYSLGTYSTHTLRKTNADFTPAVSALSGYAIWASGNNYVPWAGTNSVTVNGPYVYIYDGIQLRRFWKNTLTFIDNVNVPNGLSEGCSGIAFDYCGNIYAGTLSSIEKYDMNLNHVASIPTAGNVFDLLLSGQGDILACGDGFVANLGPTCPQPPQLTVSDTSFDASCKPGSAILFASGGTAPYSYFWPQVNQSSDTVTALLAGTYTYIVNDVFCQSVQDSVTINQLPLLQISDATVVKETCLNRLDGNATVNFTGGRAPYSFLWNTAPVQTTQTAVGLSAGVYLVTVVDADSCWDTLSVIVPRNPNPIADFSTVFKCQGTPNQFSDSSTTIAGSIVQWNWDFGNGGSADTNQNPTYTYPLAGDYNVTLIVENNFSCIDTVTKIISVYYNPVANFTVQDVCFYDSVFFTDSSLIHTSASISSYVWIFNDGSPPNTSQHPTHYYTSHGVYNVTLLVTTNQTCSNAINKTVNVFDPPSSNFTFNNTCLFDSAIFINISQNPTLGTIATWEWNFGDATPVNISTISPSHLYSNYGTYQVTLITRSSNLACADTLVDSIDVFPMPIAYFAANNICLGDSISFIDSSTVSNNNTINHWQWNFGDGSPIDTLQNPVYEYLNYGTYDVTMMSITDKGCADTINQAFDVHPLPTANFVSSNVCLGFVSSYNDLSTIPTNTTNDNIVSWIWNFDDNSSTITTQNTSHTFSAVGAYDVKLKITSSFGCVDSITHTTVINPNPQVNFVASDTIGCEPLCVNFSDVSTIVSGVNNNWSWNLGNGTIINNTNAFNYCFDNDSLFNPKNYTITLTVTSDSGCVTTLVRNHHIIVNPLPSANFMVMPITATITDPVITITNLSTGANNWYWNYGDTDTSTLSIPAPHTYADTGHYLVQLITTTLLGCSDTTYQTVVIEPDFMFYIPSAFTPDEDDVNDSFIGKGSFISSFEMFIFDRWGNLIYKTDDLNKPWDGRVNNGAEIAPQGVYVYSFNIIDFKKIKHQYKGVVTLLRKE